MASLGLRIRPLYRALRWLRGRAEWQILTRTLSRWSDDRAGSMAASIAFYTMFSLAPTMLLVSWVAGLIFGRTGAGHALTREMAALVGPGGAAVLEQVLSSAAPPSVLSASALIGLAALIFGATTVFVEINAALNVIWRAGDTLPGGIVAALKSRLLAISLLFAFAFLLTVSLTVSAFVTAATGWVTGEWKALAYAVEAVNLALSIAMTFLLFSTIYKILPSVPVPWRRVWFAGATAAVLFNVGKSLIGIYIGNANPVTTYGAASALIVVMLWVYYSAMIFLFGAELSAAHAFVMDKRRRARAKR